jgi:hypothetical protein
MIKIGFGYKKTNKLVIEPDPKLRLKHDFRQFPT